MAHKLAHEANDECDRDSNDGSMLLNRRKYVKLGGAAAVLLAAGPLGSAATSSGSTYRTDFNSGSL